jgi:hypothetical protein
VIENASPKAPRPSVQSNRRRTGGTVTRAWDAGVVDT